ncbi:MAG: hypothetical protein WAV45_12200 [Propionibacteriaceae bacterium]|nr:hypothetical protein [Micropruina sp.]HBX80914.1 hypothetical protein [Propionibacteriaceae bacterium]HBY22583.1 hypothetical protein [Propionibacteriaceae bacterium]
MILPLPSALFQGPPYPPGPLWFIGWRNGGIGSLTMIVLSLPAFFCVGVTVAVGFGYEGGSFAEDPSGLAIALAMFGVLGTILLWIGIVRFRWERRYPTNEAAIEAGVPLNG